jgi:predicted S18 family serine protease
MEGDSAKDDVATAKQEVATAEQKVATAKQEIATAKQEIATAKQEIATAKQEIADAVDDEAKATAKKNLEFALRARDSAQLALESAISNQILQEKILRQLLEQQLGDLQSEKLC